MVEAGEREAEEKTWVCSGDWRPGKQGITWGEKMRGVGAHHHFFSLKSRCIYCHHHAILLTEFDGLLRQGGRCNMVWTSIGGRRL
jgi:hypothetical protein